MQAGLDRAGAVAEPVCDLGDRQVREVEKGDRLALFDREPGQRRSHATAAVVILDGLLGQAVDRGWEQRLRPVAQQDDLDPTPARGAVDVDDDPGQPSGEPVRVPQLAQAQKRLQERLLSDVLRLTCIAAQPHCPRLDHPAIPLDEEPERHRVTGTRQHNKVTIADPTVHTYQCPVEGSRLLPCGNTLVRVRPAAPLRTLAAGSGPGDSQARIPYGTILTPGGHGPLPGSAD